MSTNRTEEDWFLRGGARPTSSPETDPVVQEADPPGVTSRGEPSDVTYRGEPSDDDDDDGPGSFGGGGYEVSAPVWPPWCFGSW